MLTGESEKKKKSLKRKNMLVCLKMKCFILTWETKRNKNQNKKKNQENTRLGFFFSFGASK